jgi:hypothetical protein
MNQSEQTRLTIDLLRRVEILEEVILGTLPSIIEPVEAEELTTKKVRKKKAPKEDSFDLDLSKIGGMSTTEIAQICNKMGHLYASRAMHREDLISLLVGEAIDVEDPLEEHRSKTFEYVQNNKRMLTSVMSCDLHCPTCPHGQVVECWSDNEDKVTLWHEKNTEQDL